MGYFLFPPVSIDTTGIATEAKQDTIITALGDVNTELDNILVELDLTPVDFLDAGVLDTSSTSIPASAGNPLELVASLASDVHAINIQDTVGAYIGVYTGAALAETLAYVGQPGQDGLIPIDILAGTRISVRNMANVALSIGEYNIVFLG